MEHPYWQKQTREAPLFPELVWSRPENKQYAGKLLIIGGNLHGFSAPGTAFNAALKAGIGVARIMLPSALEKTVSKVFMEAEYAPSTPSGSFSTKALGEFLPIAMWADGVLLAGDIGKNSETTIVFDSLLAKYSAQITLCNDMVDFASLQPKAVLNRADTLLVCNFNELQKFVTKAEFKTAITSSMDMLQFVATLHELSSEWNLQLMVLRDDIAYVAVNGQVSSTPCLASTTEAATHASVWWLQNPTKPFEALTTSLTENR